MKNPIFIEFEQILNEKRPVNAQLKSLFAFYG